MLSTTTILFHHYDDLFVLLVSLPIGFEERAHHVPKGVESFLPFYIFFPTIVPCILILSKFFIYQLMHNRVALKEY